MPDILLDTNLLIYAFDPRHTVRQEQALDVVLKLNETGRGCLSAQCLAEFASVALIKLNLPAREVMEHIEAWHSIFPVFNLTPQIVLEAARGVRDHKLAYYDAQIWASAKLNQVPVIFSEDFQNRQVLEGVRFVNPFASGFAVADW